ncbi:diguanylate cyclase (GGDEF)-like protein [Peteryoungia aggregata LMG 23059]|uniref:diguanylate cyclase n=1 Tax=Peteryoungia aggregata LMG 23059 TaxID=1368425 RepID=A0ABU0GDY9_9HYPH|nr:GGDEF domain-containing protein [Peteryoungia aggregata]MDQ0422815.1 diguanylate cyclase (GGDEF)-like protein [Peteryoungia aggregata LMG 23059]
MNGAAFFLVVNFVVAMSFSAVFAIVARRNQSRRAALWFAAGFGVASISAICELLVAYSGTPKLWAIGAFASVLAGMVMLAVGIGKLFGQRIAPWIIAIFMAASLAVSYVIYDLPRGTPMQALLYQSPFALVILTSTGIVFRHGRSVVVDRFLGVLLLVTGLHFLAKAGLAMLLGAGTSARDYVNTDYALVSQSLTAVLMVAVGLTLLATLVLEIMTAQRTESELDTLSGLTNRRGFDRGVQALLREAPDGPHALILCDLDHFKRINDTYGHDIGDLVIKTFGKGLRQYAPPGAVIGRLGGEEFAIFLPGMPIETAVQLAQRLRLEVMSLADLPSEIGVTASFGVAPVPSEAALTEAYRQADQAMYDAKNSGRNRVKRASSG